MKKLLAVIATALFAVVALAGCGSSTDTASSEKNCAKSRSDSCSSCRNLRTD